MDVNTGIVLGLFIFLSFFIFMSQNNDSDYQTCIKKCYTGGIECINACNQPLLQDNDDSLEWWVDGWTQGVQEGAHEYCIKMD